MSHKYTYYKNCPITECITRIPTRSIVCPLHWTFVDPEIQRLIYNGDFRLRKYAIKKLIISVNFQMRQIKNYYNKNMIKQGRLF